MLLNDCAQLSVILNRSMLEPMQYLLFWVGNERARERERVTEWVCGDSNSFWENPPFSGRCFGDSF